MKHVRASCSVCPGFVIFCQWAVVWYKKLGNENKRLATLYWCDCCVLSSIPVSLVAAIIMSSCLVILLEEGKGISRRKWVASWGGHQPRSQGLLRHAILNKLLSRTKMQPSLPQAFRQLEAARKRWEPKGGDITSFLYFCARCISRYASSNWTLRRGQMQYGFDLPILRCQTSPHLAEECSQVWKTSHWPNRTVYPLRSSLYLPLHRLKQIIFWRSRPLLLRIFSGLVIRHI